MARSSKSAVEPLDSPLHDHALITLVGLLFECASGLERRTDRNLRRDSNMSGSTFEVLIRLMRSPGQRSRLAALGQELAITTGGVTRLMDRLEKQGLVRRTRSHTDRRAIYAELTPAGRRAVKSALPDHVTDLETAFSVLSPSQRRQLESCLRALRPAACDSASTG